MSKYLRFFFIVFVLFCHNNIDAQNIYGTTGLLYMPTADMQHDKTFMFGGNAVNINTLPHYWSRDMYNPFTYNYYINITLFPWMEIAYTCTLVKGKYGSSYWPKATWGKFVNQDRSFHFRLRLLEEGWLKKWTPQIVIGTNDPGTHEGNGGGEIDWNGGGKGSHNYFTRYYLVATKHYEFINIGRIGIHAAFIIGNAMTDTHYKRPAIGANFKFKLIDKELYEKLLNNLNLMAEYDARKFNLGFNYSLWKDQINLTCAWTECKYFSGGIFFKVHLK